jgi:hypothetical protein
MCRQIRTWKKRVYNLETELMEMRERHRRDTASITPQNWDRLTTGHDRKLRTIYAQDYPLSQWPICVPYLNMIALVDYRMAMNKVRRSAVPLPNSIGLNVQDRIETLELETSQSEKQ